MESSGMIGMKKKSNMLQLFGFIKIEWELGGDGMN
jgi:hypothetical protein